MSYDRMGAGALDYKPCRYGGSKLVFRGPKQTLGDNYCVALGGMETFGKFVERPYPDLLQGMTGQQVVNLGCMHAGPEVFSSDPEIMAICERASSTIVQLSGVQHISNRFYRVHPRHNDRIIAVTKLLYSVFQDMDFSDVHYTGHLLTKLKKLAPVRFELVKKELQAEWVNQMKTLIAGIGQNVVLLWLSNHELPQLSDAGQTLEEPLFLNRNMLKQLTDLGPKLVEIVATQDEIHAGVDRMVFDQLEESAARQMLGPIAHQDAARQLGAIIWPL